MLPLPEQISTQLLTWAAALFIIKHLLADFILQTGWMARGKEQVDGWLAPLVSHVTVHAIGTLLITLAMAPQLAWLALLDFGGHGIIDKGKTLIQQRYRFKIDEAAYWWLLGTDQTLHHLTHLAFAVLIAGAATGM